MGGIGLGPARVVDLFMPSLANIFSKCYKKAVFIKKIYILNLGIYIIWAGGRVNNNNNKILLSSVTTISLSTIGWASFDIYTSVILKLKLYIQAKIIKY